MPTAVAHILRAASTVGVSTVPLTIGSMATGIRASLSEALGTPGRMGGIPAAGMGSPAADDPPRTRLAGFT